jgi:hypothetical protein
VGTGHDEGARERPSLVVPADPENPYPSPIVVSGGKGSYLRLPTPGTVVEGLGGRSRLNERLGAILASENYLSGEVSEPDATTLAAHDESFLQRLEVISYPTPIHTDPNGGWSVAIPIPEQVVERLGGPSGLEDRLASMSGSASGQPADADPVNAARLTADYDGLLGQIETVVNPPEH